MYKGHDLTDVQRYNAEQEERYYYERDRLAHMDMQADYQTDFQEEDNAAINPIQKDMRIDANIAIIEAIDFFLSEDTIPTINMVQSTLQNCIFFQQCGLLPVPAYWIAECMEEVAKDEENELSHDEKEALHKQAKTYQDGEEIYPNEEERMEARRIHWEEQALTQGNPPFDYSPRNAGYEDHGEEGEPDTELESLDGPFPTLAECEEEITKAMQDHLF